MTTTWGANATMARPSPARSVSGAAAEASRTGARDGRVRSQGREERDPDHSTSVSSARA